MEQQLVESRQHFLSWIESQVVRIDRPLFKLWVWCMEQQLVESRQQILTWIESRLVKIDRPLLVMFIFIASDELVVTMKAHAVLPQFSPC